MARKLTTEKAGKYVLRNAWRTTVKDKDGKLQKVVFDAGDTVELTAEQATAMLNGTRRQADPVESGSTTKGS